MGNNIFWNHHIIFQLEHFLNINDDFARIINNKFNKKDSKSLISSYCLSIIQSLLVYISIVILMFT